jgi:DNA-binding HxlR family transcriptional regulator
MLATLPRSGQLYQLSPPEMFSMPMVSSGTMTHRVDLLEKSELVKRIPDPSDRRGMQIMLTDKGFNPIEKRMRHP